jgi:hypothetical protein
MKDGVLCSCCGAGTNVRAVVVRHRQTGAPGELRLCRRCRELGDRVWRRTWEVAAVGGRPLSRAEMER